MVITFGSSSFQEDCHYLLYPNVGMLSGTSHELHSAEVERPASTDRPRDMRFYFERLS